MPHVTDRSRTLSRPTQDDADFILVRDRRHRRRYREPALLEAIRQLGNELGRGRPLVHLTWCRTSLRAGRAQNEAKPTQHSVQRTARPRHPAGYLLAAAEQEIPAARRKIALFCKSAKRVIPGARCRYDLCGADRLSREGLDTEVMRRFGVEAPEPASGTGTIVEQFSIPKAK